MGRLQLPIIDTDYKMQMQETHRPALLSFIADNCVYREGCLMQFSEFYATFMDWLGAEERSDWSKKRVALEFPTHHPRGLAGKKNTAYVGNIVWAGSEEKQGKKLVRVARRLVEEGDTNEIA